MEKEKYLGLRIDFETHEKLKSLAEYEGRSINGEVLYLIRQAIAQHEQQKRGFKIIHHLLYFIVQSNLFINRSALLLPYVEESVAYFLEGITSL